MQFNPYIAGNPIGEDGFFGRDDVLREVLRVLHNPKENAIVLYGQRRIGKTSVLLQLERQLQETGDFDAVYFDLQDKAGLPLDKVLYDLAQHIAFSLNLPTPEPDQFNNTTNDYFQNSFLPQAIECNGKIFVLLFDEFDVLDSPGQDQAVQSFFPYLRVLIGSHPKLKFVFVIGRRPEDLSYKTISVFKGVRSTNVGLLTQADTTAILRQSEADGTFMWQEAAVKAVWELTKGHPYFTQLLGSVIWEQNYDEDVAVQTVTTDMVKEAISTAFEHGRNAFVWIWNGLPPAERVVMAAMAEAKEPVIRSDRLVQILNESGVRLIVRQLELAPETLVEWDVFQPVDGGYRFAVPLLRLWVQRNRPLQRTKEELDRVEPQAERLFQSGQNFHQQGNTELAETQLRYALQTNPNHLKAKLLLGQILLEQDKLAETIQVLEEAYAYDPGGARPDLIRALLAQAQKTEGEAEQLTIYERVLQLDPSQLESKKQKETLVAQRQQRLLANKVAKAKQLATKERWREAAIIYEQLQTEFPDDKQWQDQYQKAQIEADLLQKYNEALEALEKSNKQTAQRLLVQIIGLQPGYKEAARHLLLSIQDDDQNTLAGLEQADRIESPHILNNHLDSIDDLIDDEIGWARVDEYSDPFGTNSLLFINHFSQLQSLRTALQRVYVQALVGLPGMGKTKLLKQIKTEFENEFTWVEFNFDDENLNLKDFWIKAGQQLGFSQNILQQLEGKDAFEAQIFVIEKMKAFIGEGHSVCIVLDRFDILIKQEKYDISFLESLMEILSTYRVVVLLSSYERIKILQEEMASYTISNKSKKKRERQRDRLANLFGMIRSETLITPFNEDVVFKLIDDSLRTSSIKFSPEEKRFVFIQSGGIPSLVKWISSEIFTYKLDQLNSPESNQFNSVEKKLRTNKKGFTDFWEPLPENLKSGILLIALLDIIKHRGTKWSYTILNQVLQKHFTNQFADLKEYGVLKQKENGDFAFRSEYLIDWSKRQFQSLDHKQLTILLKQINHQEDRKKLEDYTNWVIGRNTSPILRQNNNWQYRLLGWGIVILLISIIWIMLIKIF